MHQLSTCPSACCVETLAAIGAEGMLIGYGHSCVYVPPREYNSMLVIDVNFFDDNQYHIIAGRR